MSEGREVQIAWRRVIVMVVLFLIGSAAAVAGFMAAAIAHRPDWQEYLLSSMSSVLGITTEGAQYRAGVLVFAVGWSLVGVASSMLWEPRPIQRPKLPIVLGVVFPFIALATIPMIVAIALFLWDAMRASARF
jgi:hypothetical protein